MAEGKLGDRLISFESGHYKRFRGMWKGDSVWARFVKEDGGELHVNKEKVEYMETFGDGNVEASVGDEDVSLDRERRRAEIALLNAQAERTLSEVAPGKNEFHEFKEYVSGFIQGVDERIHTIEKSVQEIKNRMGQCA